MRRLSFVSAVLLTALAACSDPNKCVTYRTPDVLLSLTRRTAAGRVDSTDYTPNQASTAGPAIRLPDSAKVVYTGLGNYDFTTSLVRHDSVLKSATYEFAGLGQLKQVTVKYLRGGRAFVGRRSFYYNPTALPSYSILTGGATSTGPVLDSVVYQYAAGSVTNLTGATRFVGGVAVARYTYRYDSATGYTRRVDEQRGDTLRRRYPHYLSQAPRAVAQANVLSTLPDFALDGSLSPYDLIRFVYATTGNGYESLFTYDADSVLTLTSTKNDSATLFRSTYRIARGATDTVQIYRIQSKLEESCAK